MDDLAVSEEDEEPEGWRGGNGAVVGREDSEAEVLHALGKEAVKSSQSKETRVGKGQQNTNYFQNRFVILKSQENCFIPQ
jgi:hypothetical protein